MYMYNLCNIITYSCRKVYGQVFLEKIGKILLCFGYQYLVNELSWDRILNLIGTLNEMRQVCHCFYRTLVTPLPFALHTGMFMPCIKVFYFILLYLRRFSLISFVRQGDYYP